MMTKFILIVLLVSATTIFPQQQKKYFDAPFGGGIGYVPAWYFPKVEPINLELQNIGMPELSTSGFYSSGGAGFVYIGFIKFLRIIFSLSPLMSIIKLLADIPFKRIGFSSE